MSSRRELGAPARDLRAGAVAVAPIVVGIVPFGLIVGLAAVDAGLGLAEALGFSVFVFAGAAQLAALDLLGSDAAVAVVITTALVINVRMVMYSASIAPYLAALPRRRRVLGTYFLIDQVYALAIVRYRDQPDLDRWWFYLGAALPLWITWQTTTALGVFVGDAVPDAIPLGFAVPLAFLSLLIPTLTDRPALVAALAAAVVATLAVPLPANAGMPLAALAGIGAGWLAAVHRERVVPG